MQGDVIMNRIIARTAELADIDPGLITDETSLEALGLDSSDAVILAMEVEELVGKEIEVGIFLRFGTLREAAEEISKQVRGA